MSEAKTEEPEIPEGIIPTFFPTWDDPEIDAVGSVLQEEGNVLTEGQNVTKFETEFAKYVGAKYCVLFPSHCTAMYCTLVVLQNKFTTRSLSIPSFGGHEIYNPARLALYNPVLCEVNDLGCLVLRDNEPGVVYHRNGRLGKPSLIEDCRDVINHHTKDMVSIYDFSSKAHLTLCGDGGAVCCDDSEIFTALVRMKSFGKNTHDQEEYYDDDHKMWGMNFGVNEINAAFGLAQLKGLDKKLKRIGDLHKILKETVTKAHYLEGVPTRFLEIIVPDAVNVQIELIRKGMMTTRFPRPLHLQHFSRYSGRMDNRFDVSDNFYKTGLYIPSMTFMTDEDFSKITNEINSVL